MNELIVRQSGNTNHLKNADFFIAALLHDSNKSFYLSFIKKKNFGGIINDQFNRIWLSRYL